MSVTSFRLFVTNLTATCCRPAKNLVGDLVLSTIEVMEFVHIANEVVSLVFDESRC